MAAPKFQFVWRQANILLAFEWCVGHIPVITKQKLKITALQGTKFFRNGKSDIYLKDTISNKLMHGLTYGTEVWSYYARVGAGGTLQIQY